MDNRYKVRFMMDDTIVVEETVTDADEAVFRAEIWDTSEETNFAGAVRIDEKGNETYLYWVNDEGDSGTDIDENDADYEYLPVN